MTFKEAIINMMQSITDGNLQEADSTLSTVLEAKISDLLEHKKKEIAETVFASTEGDVVEDILSQEEFDALTDEEQAEWELVELEDLEEGNAENKAKKNSYEDSVGKKKIKGSEEFYQRKGAARRLMRVDRSLSGFDKLKKEEVEQIEEGNAENKSKKNAYVKNLGKKAAQKQFDRESKVSNIARLSKLAGRITSSNSNSDSHDYMVRKGRRKLSRESVEPINELSKKTLGTYINKAANDMANRAFTSGTTYGKNEESPFSKKEKKRGLGIMNAVAKLRKEENDPCWKGYVKKGMKQKGDKVVPNCTKESNDE